VLAGLNDLTTLEPETTAPWHTTLNGTLTPDTVAAGSHRKAWWQCPSGHVMEGHDLRPGRAAKERLSRVCRKGQEGP